MDACTPLNITGDYTCACGGGWVYGTQLVRMRQFVCDSTASKQNRENCFESFQKWAPTCCAPQVDLEELSGENTDPLCAITPTASDAIGAWVDVTYDCKDSGSSLCQEADRNEFHLAYTDCRPQMSNETCLKIAHASNKNKIWRGTRDKIFDDGSIYQILLEPSASRDCLNQKLDLVVDDPIQFEGLPIAYTAAWTCGDSPDFYFWQAQFNCTTTPPLVNGGSGETPETCERDFGVYFGSNYFVMTSLKSGTHNTDWYCLSLPDTGQQEILKDEQIIWRSYDERKCLSIYLGERDVFEFKKTDLTGIGIYTDNPLVKHESNLEIAVFPQGVDPEF